MNGSTITSNQKHKRSRYQKSRYNENRRPHTERRRPEHAGEGLSVRVIYRGDSEEAKTQALDKALSQLKKILSKEGVTQQLKERQYFVSDSRKRYLKKKQLIYKQKTKLMKKEKKFKKRYK